MEVPSFPTFRLAGEVQISSPLKIGPINQLKKKLFANLALTEAPAVELTDRAQDVRHTLPAQLGHAQRGGAREESMNVHQVVVPGVLAQPAIEPRDDGEFTQGAHGRIPTSKGQNRHDLTKRFLLMPAA